MKFGKCELAIRRQPLENGSFREVIVIDGLIRIITIIRLFVNGNSDFKNLYREGGRRFVDIKERMANVGMTQVDMILELQKRGYAVQPPMMSSILRGVYTYPKAKQILAVCKEILKERENESKSAEQFIGTTQIRSVSNGTQVRRND